MAIARSSTMALAQVSPYFISTCTCSAVANSAGLQGRGRAEGGVAAWPTGARRCYAPTREFARGKHAFLELWAGARRIHVRGSFRARAPGWRDPLSRALLSYASQVPANRHRSLVDGPLVAE